MRQGEICAVKKTFSMAAARQAGSIVFPAIPSIRATRFANSKHEE
jgi:hypothetical protein